MELCLFHLNQSGSWSEISPQASETTIQEAVILPRALPRLGDMASSGKRLRFFKRVFGSGTVVFSFVNIRRGVNAQPEACNGAVLIPNSVREFWVLRSVAPEVRPESANVSHDEGLLRRLVLMTSKLLPQIHQEGGGGRPSQVLR